MVKGVGSITVFKLSAAGDAITNATYLGGSGSEGPSGIAADADGNVYVTGSTTSNDFPLANALQTHNAGGPDVFVTKLKPDLSGLLISTYLGGGGTDWASTIAIDAGRNIYVAGATGSSNFPTANAIIAVRPFSTSPFVTKITTTGTLAYSTYFGGTAQQDVIYSIAALDDGTLFLTGDAASVDFPLLPTSNIHPLGFFISSFSPVGQLMYSTVLLGGGGAGTAISVDSSGQVYVIGLISPNSYTKTVNAVQNPAVPEVDCGGLGSTYMVVMDSARSFIFASYLPNLSYFGDASALPRIAVASPGSIRFAGLTTALFPLVNPLQVVDSQYLCRNDGLAQPVLAAIELSTSAPVLGLGPMQVSFPSDQPVGTSSTTPQKINVQNLGTEALTISSIQASGDYTVTDTCNGTVTAGGICSASVNFTPTAGGVRTGTLIFKDNASGSPHVVQLSGTGIAPQVTLGAASLTFDAQLLNTTSSAKTVTLTNSGGVRLTVSQIEISGEFAQTNTCGTSLPAGASCTISVTFTPTSAGTKTGQILITDDAPGSPQTVALSGTGASGPLVTLSAAQLTFSTQNVSSESAGQSVTVSNIGVSALSITSISVSGDFAQTNTCGSTVAVGAACTVTVTFKPTVPGARTGALAISDNAPNSPHTVAVSGTGADFAITVPTGGDKTTVSAGQTASFNLSVAPAGFSGTVNFTCTELRRPELVQ